MQYPEYVYDGLIYLKKNDRFSRNIDLCIVV